MLRITEDEYRLYSLPYEYASIVNIKTVYRDSLLLVYTSNGQVFIYNEILDRFERFINLKKELNSVFMSTHSILIGSDHSLWISTTLGFYQYLNGQLIPRGNFNSGVSFLAWKTDQSIIVTTRNRLFLYQIPSDCTLPLDTGNTESLPAFNSIMMDSSRNILWIGTLSEGLFYYDFADERTVKFSDDSFPRQPVKSLVYNYDSTLFVGIDGQGIWQIDPTSRKVIDVHKDNIDDPTSLRGNGVYDIFRDENNRVWVCTYSDGLSYFDQVSPMVSQITHQINNPNSLVNNHINSVIQDRKGRLWLGTNNGISCWDVKNNVWRNFYSDQKDKTKVFLTLCEDRKGRIWAGTYASGIYVLDAETGAERHHYSSKNVQSPGEAALFFNYIFDIYEDREGDLWIGGVNTEVMRYHINEDRFERFGIQPLYVFDEYTNDRLLLGCTYGLGIKDKRLNNARIMASGFIVEDLLVSDSIIWICTNGDGLIRYNPSNEEKLQFSSVIGLPSNFINSIVRAGEYFWLGTEDGLCRFHPEYKTVQTYSSVPGLSNVSFNRNAVCKLNDGQLAWGSNKGLILFHPDSIHETVHPGRIFIQDLSISGRSIRETTSLKLDRPVNMLREIKLKHYQNTITLELLPIGVAPGSRFSWKLEGLEDNWSPPSNNRMVTFSNISSKNFNLRIRLYDSSLSGIIDERSLAISIKPPFWSTWYFFVLVFVFITGIFYLIFWYYIASLKQQHTEEKVRFFTNTAHDIRTSLTLVKAPVEELSKEEALSRKGRYYLDLAKQQVNRLSAVVTQLMDFQKVDIGRGQLVWKNLDLVPLIRNRFLMFESLAQGTGLTLSFHCERASFITAIDEVKVEKIVDNLVSNAIKYSLPGGTVSVNLKFLDTKWQMDVSDQGIGMDKKAQRHLFKEFYRAENAINSRIVGSGIGLLLVKSYVNLMGGSIFCSSQENEGSVFQVIIPVKRLAEGDIETREPVGSALDEPSVIDSVVSPEPAVAVQPVATMNVLIVEDNDDLRGFLHSILSDEFHVFS
ncbi:MAG TPA: two-component regulator propeller domain-containing protein, partial [Prolixibacteraceae bacterium]|nr:two-component regulator propeller domain-containing protein [Prolixibacteraceae bacterium]